MTPLQERIQTKVRDGMTLEAIAEQEDVPLNHVWYLADLDGAQAKMRAYARSRGITGG